MKKLSVSMIALVAAIAAAPVAAHADSTPGWYVGGGFGGTMGQDPTIHSVRGEHSARDEDINLAVQGSGGYSYYNGLRIEGEYFHNQINVNNIDSERGAGGHVTNNDIFANVLYDFKNPSMFTPYVGVGAGPDFINVKSVGSTTNGYLKGDTLVLGYQGIAGVSAQLDPNWAVTADYRYVSSLDAKVDSTAGGQGRIENASHNLMLGVRYSFDTPQATPMRSAAAPAVAPVAPAKTGAVAPMPQDFMVFFDFNKATLTPEAKRIIASAAKEFKAGHFVKIAITGHTDTVGSAGYNKKLSDSRAKAVEAELAKLGVAPSAVSEAGVGKDGLLVPTADGVREAQNRRAEIVLSK